jgi:hypothetical protein
MSERRSTRQHQFFPPNNASRHVSSGSKIFAVGIFRVDMIKNNTLAQASNHRRQR